jgi:putative flippase GtrA
MTPSEPKRSLKGQIWRFAASGAANSALTFILYEVLLLLMPYWLAFTLSFAAGIIFVAFVNANWVFGAKTVAARVKLGCFYVLTYFVGLQTLTLLVTRLHVPPGLAPFGVLLVMVPVNFVGSRLLLGDRADRSEKADP